jgi:catechol 2,3-dioxygenase-like lactoylglutathione lyase family enzyme
MGTEIEFAGAVILVSNQVSALAAFYNDVLGIELTLEQHDDDDVHYGGYIGPNHFAIHPPQNFAYAPETAFGAVRVALHTFDFDGLVERLKRNNIDFVLNPVDLGWSRMMAIRDPDGNAVEILQGSAQHLKAAAVRYRATAAKIESHIERTTAE